MSQQDQFGGVATAYVESASPGSGVLPPRAHATTDAPALSLDGQWAFRLVGGLRDLTAGFETESYDDTAWDRLAVPSCWQLVGRPDSARYGDPAYTNVTFPFPIDPPHVPDENPTGEYRRRFGLPKEWLGAGRVLVRFEGVDSAFAVWCNGAFVGEAIGSRLTHEFDVTDLLRPGTNLVAVRVHQWSAGSYLEDQDMWWVSGIFRSVTLLSRPDGAISDFFVHAGFDAATGVGTLHVDADPGVRLTVAELGLVDVDPALPQRIDCVEPWSAERPRLYDGILATAAETLRIRIGFRTVEVVEAQLLVNGAPLMIRGVNRHEWHPETGRTLDEATMCQDIELMKQHNINAVRTSHYPPDARFLGLCDEYGLWVLDECDLETHGFEKVGWERNPSDDATWRPAFLDRIERTVERDKNHPCVIGWSLGNESGTGRNLAAMAAWVRERDASRFIHYEGDWDSAYVDVYSRMYADHAETELIGGFAEPPCADPADDGHRRSLPFVLCEYAHAMGNGPGGLSEYQALFDRYNRLAGGFVWEWMDHCVPRRAVDGPHAGELFFAYGGDFGEPVHDGNFIADGLVFPDRTPSPGLIEFAKVIEPIRIEIGSDTVRIRNLHMTIGTGHLLFPWRVEGEGQVIDDGLLAVPPIAPGGSVEVPFPEAIRTAAGLDARDPAGEIWLTVSAVLADATIWSPAGHQIAWGQAHIAAGPQSGALPREPEPVVVRTDDGWALGPARFDEWGVLRAFGTVDLLGPRLDLWRATTDNDELAPGESPSQSWRRVGLHRCRTKILEADADARTIAVRTRTMPAGTSIGYDTVLTWSWAEPHLRLHLAAVPLGDWRWPVPRLGVRMGVPRRWVHLDWFGLGPGEAYADTCVAQRVGRHRASLADLQTPYVRPQENGNRRRVRWAEMSGGDGPTMRVSGPRPFDLTLRPWTSETLDAARHTTDLVADPRWSWLNLDVGQQGIGSGACGPVELPEYTLKASAFELDLTFEVSTAGADLS